MINFAYYSFHLKFVHFLSSVTPTDCEGKLKVSCFLPVLIKFRQNEIFSYVFLLCHLSGASSKGCKAFRGRDGHFEEARAAKEGTVRSLWRQYQLRELSLYSSSILQ